MCLLDDDVLCSGLGLTSLLAFHTNYNRVEGTDSKLVPKSHPDEVIITFVQRRLP